MTLQECYAAMGGDYDDAMGRLRSERLLQKFVLKFLDDGNFKLLCQSLADGRQEEAFRAAHTIKGMCQNLSFRALGKSSSRLTEALRAGESDTRELLECVMEDYRVTEEAIRAYQAGLN